MNFTRIEMGLYFMIIVAVLGASLFLLLSHDEDRGEIIVVDWRVDIEPKKFPVFNTTENGSLEWSYEYELIIDIWLLSESTGGGYPKASIMVEYVVNNRTEALEFISIKESGGSADHHNLRIVTTNRVNASDDIRVVMRLSDSFFEHVEGGEHNSRAGAWYITYKVDLGVEQ